MISPVYVPAELHLLQEAFPDVPAPLFCQCSQSTSLAGFTFLFYDYSHHFFRFSLDESCVSLYCTAKCTRYTCTYIPSFFGFPSHSGHHRALNRLLGATQHVHISYPFCTWYQQCAHANPSLPMHPIPAFPSYDCSYCTIILEHMTFSPSLDIF